MKANQKWVLYILQQNISLGHDMFDLISLHNRLFLQDFDGIHLLLCFVPCKKNLKMRKNGITILILINTPALRINQLFSRNNCTLKCLSIGTPKAINFAFVSNEKLMFYRCASIQAHCNEIVIYLNFGTPKIMNFPFGTNGKFIIFRCPNT